ncbi:MAG TPA: hemolysin family protein [Parachlamydiaceae bacterium]|nr:hemolysin family protein [Parachlamydiaceae bacterium]
MFLVICFLAMIFFLLGTFFLTALTSAFRSIHKRDSKKQIIAAGKWFFYRPFHLYFFPDQMYEGLFFAATCAQNIARYCYIAFSVIFFMETPLFNTHSSLATASLDYDFSPFWITLSLIAFSLVSFVVGEYLPRILGMRFPEKMLRFCTPFSSIFMFLAFPITFLFLKIAQSFSRTIYFDNLQETEAQAKQEIIDIIQDAQLSPGINLHDKKIIESVLSFRERIAREVMVPRVNVFSLPADTTIKEAANLLAAEGYSRTPIYSTTIDDITGVLMYKDILTKFREYEQKGNDNKILEATIETIQKNVLYTPETKNISNLLQEFRKKQVHLAIVVDEYGGTEGIVTIEDILEEIVGEISDEYDDEKTLFTEQPDGSWIIDAHMNILDAEEATGITIPQEGEYDTVGGYVFHCAGAIPSKGFIIHQDEFELEVLDSNERVVEKVRIKPLRDNRSDADVLDEDDEH